MVEWRIGGVEELICRLPHSPTLNSPTILSVSRTMTPRRGMRLAGCEYYTTFPPLQTEGKRNGLRGGVHRGLYAALYISRGISCFLL